MHLAILTIHSLLRWAALVFALAAVVPPWMGWLRGSPHTQGSRHIGRLLVIVLDAQLLAGLVLYFALSPITHGALAQVARMGRGPAGGYWTFTHPRLGLAGIVLAHVGQALSKRAPDARLADRREAVFFTAAALAIAAATPWPFLPQARPLWPY